MRDYSNLKILTDCILAHYLVFLVGSLRFLQLVELDLKMRDVFLQSGTAVRYGLASLVKEGVLFHIRQPRVALLQNLGLFDPEMALDDLNDR